jgi:uncharacterized protein (DUF433 family)
MSHDLHRRQDLRSLDLHLEAVRVLKEHPERIQRALEVLDRWEVAVDPRSKPLLDEWRRIIADRLWDLAVEDSDRGQQLRQASPLSFVLEPSVRDEVIHRWRADVLGGLIVRDPQVMGGVPCFAGTRVPVETVLGCLDAGDAFEETRNAYPFLTPRHVEAARAFADQHLDAVRERPRWVSAFTKATRRK